MAWIEDHARRRAVLDHVGDRHALVRALLGQRRERLAEVVLERLRGEDDVPPPVRPAFRRPRGGGVRQVGGDGVEPEPLGAERAPRDGQRSREVHQRVPSIAWRRSATRRPRMRARAR